MHDVEPRVRGGLQPAVFDPLKPAVNAQLYADEVVERRTRELAAAPADPLDADESVPAVS